MRSAELDRRIVLQEIQIAPSLVSYYESASAALVELCSESDLILHVPATTTGPLSPNNNPSDLILQIVGTSGPESTKNLDRLHKIAEDKISGRDANRELAEGQRYRRVGLRMACWEDGVAWTGAGDSVCWCCGKPGTPGPPPTIYPDLD